MKIILPKTFVDIAPEVPLFFLAGPVSGGNDWQSLFCEELQKHLADFYAALPCPYPSTHPLCKIRTEGNNSYFTRQLNWERHYMNLASASGCLVFWLACESQTEPRTDGYPYAMDTRGEIGEWRGRMMHNSRLRVVIGAEANFPGLDVIQRNFNLALNRYFHIYETLGETTKAAVRTAKSDINQKVKP